MRKVHALADITPVGLAITRAGSYGLSIEQPAARRPCSCRRVRRSVASGLVICTALAALSLPVPAHAQFAGKASATGQYESNSNVFDLESGFAPGTNGIPRSDTYYAYGAEFDGNYSLGRQQLYATASTTKYDYQHFTEL